MDDTYYGIPHTHEIKQPENNELYHPDCDPRLLWETCAACKTLMQDWQVQIQGMQASGV